MVPSTNLTKAHSPTNTFSFLNKTTPISPLRSKIGGSKLKERPSIDKNSLFN